MGVFNEFTILKEKLDEDVLHLVKYKTGKRLDRAHIKGYMTVYKYRDKDTRQIVLYIPSLELSAYGADEDKATEMIKFSLDDYFRYLFTLTLKQLQSELLNLKWKQNPLRHKDYSNPSENVRGQLKNLNAVSDKVEQLTIVAK